MRPPETDRPSRYPSEHEAHVALRDGSTVHVRPVRPDDREAIRAFLDTVSRESIAFRFFGIPQLEWIVDWSLDVDYVDRFALVAETGSPPAIIAHAAYVRESAACAEVAFLVADSWQGRGISTILLAHLAGMAERQGIATLTAEVLPANHRMISLFRESGFPVELRVSADAISIELPTSLTPAGLARFEERERVAAVAAVRSFLAPRTVAVVGASRRRGTMSGEILRNLLTGEFTGAVYAVNPHAPVVQSLPAHPTVSAVPAAIDLAVIAVPATEVLDVARDCASAGVRALLIISSGFAETGADGARRQRKLLAICRQSGMRVIGPNCLGVINTDPEVGLNATIAPTAARPGSMGFMSQSGSLGLAIIEAAGRQGLGLSSFVSVGNKADLSGNDMLCYWEQDPGTEVALLYLESFGNPRKFARIARRFARRKPLLAVKSGRSGPGPRAGSSHTAALLSAADITVDALFAQAGVIRADTLHDLFAVAALLTTQPLPSGDRVAIVTNAHGPGIMCADACLASGVAVPVLPQDVEHRLLEVLPAGAAVTNPINMLATATPDHYRRTLQTLIETDSCDAILTVFVTSLVTDAAEAATAIREVALERGGVPIAAVFMTAEGPPAQLAGDGVRVPGYEFPENAVRAVALAAQHGRWRATPDAPAPDLTDIRPDEAAAIISAGMAAAADWLPMPAVHELLACYGLPLVPTRFAGDAEGAADAASELGMPVVLKATAQGVVHKTEAGAVRLGLRDGAEVRAAAADIEAAVQQGRHRVAEFVIQPMVEQGVELIVGVVSDPSFGPVLACGAGGTTAELQRDISVRITPLSAHDPGEMLRALRSYPLLQGYRGTPPADLAAMEDVLLRISAMVKTHPEIVELDCNPVIARPDGAVIVDARVRVHSAPVPQPVAAVRT